MPSFRFELRCQERGELRVAGIDEAGRGPLAGPVYAAAAVIDRTRAARKLLRMIDDSKKLSHEQREEAYEAMVVSGVVQFAIAEASVEEIDRINILQATFLAMRRALAALAEQPEVVPPDVVLVDGNRAPPQLGCRAETIVGGDAHSYSIAAASIFAKVARDRYMTKLAETFPGYGWESNRGYGSAQHLAALKLLGPTPHHRMSFAPLSRLV
ncbi:MAG: ribonuclease HII [Reyranella sp.]|nr:ribonuclease HII [Reyranella sp.]